MKKFVFIFSCLFVLVGISGCGSTKVLECTSGKTPGNNMSASGNVKYIFKNNKLSKAEFDVVFGDITIDNLSSYWDSFVAQFTEQNKPVSEPGFVRTVKSDDENYTFTVSIEIDYDKISQETMEKYDVDDIGSKTYNEIKELATSDRNMTCK